MQILQLYTSCLETSQPHWFSIAFLAVWDQSYPREWLSGIQSLYVPTQSDSRRARTL